MLKESDRLFYLTQKYHYANIFDLLKLMPRSELIILKIAFTASEMGLHKNTSVSEIAKYLDISPPAISKALKKLREKGLVEININEEDRRNIYVTVTDEGKAALEETGERIRAFMGGALERLEPGELKQFTFLCEKVMNAVMDEIKERTSATIQKEGGAPHA